MQGCVKLLLKPTAVIIASAKLIWRQMKNKNEKKRKQKLYSCVRNTGNCSEFLPRLGNFSSFPSAPIVVILWWQLRRILMRCTFLEPCRTPSGHRCYRRWTRFAQTFRRAVNLGCEKSNAVNLSHQDLWVRRDFQIRRYKNHPMEKIWFPFVARQRKRIQEGKSYYNSGKWARHDNLKRKVKMNA